MYLKFEFLEIKKQNINECDKRTIFVSLFSSERWEVLDQWNCGMLSSKLLYAIYLIELFEKFYLICRNRKYLINIYEFFVDG